MKKQLITLLLALSLMPLTLKATPICMQTLIYMHIDRTLSDAGKEDKASAAPISIIQTDNVFTFLDYLVGETVKILSGDIVVYSTVVTEDGTVVVPDSLNGEYRLVLYVDDKVYSAEVAI